jgi:hypothetical protein
MSGVTDIEPGSYVRHKYGGLYMVLGVDDAVVRYRHCWPFPLSDRVKPHHEFVESFRKMDRGDAALLMESDRLEAQRTIQSYKEVKRSFFSS